MRSGEPQAEGAVLLALHQAIRPQGDEANSGSTSPRVLFAVFVLPTTTTEL